MSETRVREQLAMDLVGCASVLDVGTGAGKYLHTLPPWITRREALDADPAALIGVQADATYCGPAEIVLPVLRSRSLDAVLALDVLEHLERADGVAMLHEMQRIARQRIIVFTPEGFFRLEYPNPWLTHRSGWSVADLEGEGFHVDRWSFDYGFHDGERPALWAVRNHEAGQ